MPTDLQKRKAVAQLFFYSSSDHPVSISVTKARADEKRKSVNILETTSCSPAGRPTSIVLTKVKGAWGFSEEDSLPSARILVGLAEISLCSANLLILDRKKNEF